MFYKVLHLLILNAMLAGLIGCQAVSFTDGYKANNCGMTGSSCSNRSRGGTVTMNGR